MGMKLTLDVEHYREIVHEVRERLRLVPEIEDETIMELIINEILSSAMRVSVDSPQAMENIASDIEEMMRDRGICNHDVVRVETTEVRLQDYRLTEGWDAETRTHRVQIDEITCTECDANLTGWLKEFLEKRL